MMLAVSFTFPSGRYHATPWGHHVNEAMVAWPPEPVRLLRALYDVWKRKGDHDRHPKHLLDSLLDKLAGSMPFYRLPAAVHSHIPAYVPDSGTWHNNKRKSGLIYDGFLCFDRHNGGSTKPELIVAWPDADLTGAEKELAADLIGKLGYLGRAQSIVDGKIVDLPADADFNAGPSLDYNGTNSKGTEQIETLVPLTPDEWRERRQKLLAGVSHEKGKRRELLEYTLPEQLSDALAVETDNIRNAGWSGPPAMRKEIYMRPKFDKPKIIRKQKTELKPYQKPGRPQAARFVIGGRHLPMQTDSLPLGELVKKALAKICKNEALPEELSGRSLTTGEMLQDNHRHCFYLAESSEPASGLIDHLVVYSPVGFSNKARGLLKQLKTIFWSGLKQQIALDGIIDADEGEWPPAKCGLLRSSNTWISATPYLKTRYRLEADEQIRREIKDRGMPDPAAVEIVPHGEYGNKRPLDFRNELNRKGKDPARRPDGIGCFARIEFPQAIRGPLALGYGCHYGLGLFLPATAQEQS